jgi:HemX protein
MPALLPDRTWLWIAAVFYAVAFIRATWSIVRHHPRTRTVMLVIIGAGLVAHTIGLYQRGLSYGGCPLGNRLEVIQFIIWSFTVLYLILGPAFRLSLLGYFTSGLAAAMSVTSLAFPAWDPAERRPPFFGGEPWIEVHGSLALVAYGAFAALALTSLMFLLQTFSLKRKRLHGMFPFLPSIVALESINLRLLVTGPAVLTFSILIGYIYFRREPDSVTSAKLLIAGGVWAAYLGVLILRLRRRLVSNGLAWACVALFLIALLSLGPIMGGMKRAEPPPAEAASAVPGDL